ncbi:MAG: DUF4130 domain-containing protein [Lachnospiraceae bacterium]|nr:DUF4130 domain-containing protein [Lachnospiraceae bacterium]
MYYFICRPSMCGILTGIYDAWDFALRIKNPAGAKLADTSRKADPEGSAGNAGHDLLRLVVDGGFRFCDYSKFIDVLPNEAKAEMVSNGIAQKLGDELHDVCLTAMQSSAKDRVDTLYRFLLYAFGVGQQAIEHTERPEVQRLRAYYQSVRREGALLYGFPGFIRHVTPLGEIYVARIRPKNDVLDFLVLHFVNQRPQDTFLIYDERRCTYVLHIPGLPLQRGCQKIFPGSASERTQLPDPMETILTLVDRATAAPPDGAANIALHLLRGA